MEEKKTSGSVQCEGRITAAVNGWLERWWRVGKVPVNVTQDQSPRLYDIH